MTDDHIPDAREKVPAVDAPVKRRVRPLLAPRDWQAMALREAAELTGTTEGAARLAESRRYGELADEIERLRASCIAFAQAAATDLAAERWRCKERAVQIVEWHRNDYNRQQIDPIVADLRAEL